MCFSRNWDENWMHRPCRFWKRWWPIVGIHSWTPWRWRRALGPWSLTWSRWRWKRVCWPGQAAGRICTGGTSPMAQKTHTPWITAPLFLVDGNNLRGRKAIAQTDKDRKVFVKAHSRRTRVEVGWRGKRASGANSIYSRLPWRGPSFTSLFVRLNLGCYVWINSLGLSYLFRVNTMQKIFRCNTE